MKRYLCIVLLLVPGLLQARLAGQARIDSLLKELPNVKEDSIKVYVLGKISWDFRHLKPDEGIKYGLQGLAIAEKAGLTRGEAFICNSLARNYSSKSDNTKAVNYDTEALRLHEQLGRKNDIAADHGNIANDYLAQNNYTLALEHFLKAQKIYEEINDKPGLAIVLVSIGNVYHDIKNYPKAEAYYLNALPRYKETDNRDGLARCMTGLADNYFEMNNYALALDYIGKAEKIYEDEGDKYGMMGAASLTGNIYQQKKEYSKSLDAHLEGLHIATAVGYPEGVVEFLNNIGGDYLYMAKDKSGNRFQGDSIPSDRESLLKKAIASFERSIAKSKEISRLSTIMNDEDLLVDAYRQLGDYKSALEHREAYGLTKDSVFSVDNKVKIATLETQREADLKEKQIEINKIQETRKETERLFYIIGIGILILFIILITRNYTKQKTTNKQLADEKAKSDELSERQKELMKQQDLMMKDQNELMIQKDELMAQLGASAQMKSKFLANISHELRTPVTLLTGMLELVKDGKGVREGDHEKLVIAYQNSQKLQYMVNDILDLSKLDHTETKMSSEPKEIGPMLKRMVYAFETLMNKEQISLAYNDAGAQGLYVNVDEKRFEKVINNLVYNAIKFNRKGGWIAINLNSDMATKEVVIEISDSAGGIKTEDLPHIFERYYQGGSPGVKAQGAGIGLSLVNEYTSLMGGSVTVESREGDGTTFRLRFSVIEVHSAIPRQALEPIELPAEAWTQFPEMQTVLLVEDNAEMRYYMKEVLGGKVNIAETANGKEALIWLESHVADLIISDIMMPEMDGTEFISKLKSSEVYKKIPVITLTALSAVESQLGMLRMGVDDYMVKPFNADELRVRVYNLLHNRAERNAFSQLPSEPADIAETSKEADEFRTRITDFVLARIRNINISVFDLAFEFAMSERQLYRLAKSLTGCTPAQLIKEVRLQKAYELLVSGKMTKVEDVSKQVGFETAGYFSRQFAERFGRRPTEFL